MKLKAVHVLSWIYNLFPNPMEMMISLRLGIYLLTFLIILLVVLSLIFYSSVPEEATSQDSFILSSNFEMD